MVYVCKKYLYNKKRSIARQDVKLARRKNYRELANGVPRNLRYDFHIATGLILSTGNPRFLKYISIEE